MGKDYLESVYKKSYTDEYVKSYAKSFDQQSKYNEFVAEYNTVSKKIGTRTYSKIEKGVYTGVQLTIVDAANTVKAEGGRRPIKKRPAVAVVAPPTAAVKEQPKPTVSKKENTQQKQTDDTPPTYLWPENENKTPQNQTIGANEKENILRQPKQIIDTPPVYIPPTAAKTTTKKSTTESSKKTAKNTSPYSYIEPNSVSNPVTRLTDGSYYNIYTKEEIDNDEARRILDYDGYEVKDTPSTKTILLVSLFTIPLKIISPIAIIVWGLWLMVKPTTVMQKTKQFLTLKITVGATDNEKLENKNKGILCIVAGIFVAVIQIMLYS